MLDIQVLLETQSAFNQGRFIDYNTATNEERQRLTKDLVLHLLGEAHEVLGHIDWKMHKPIGRAVDKFELAVELVDVLKFWAAIPTLWGITAEQLTEIHRKKSEIVEGRWEVAHKLPPTGPALRVDWATVVEDMSLTGHGLIGALLERYDMTLVVDHEAAELTSEGLFELDWILTGIHRVRWTAGEFDDRLNYIGIQTRGMVGALVWLPDSHENVYPGVTTAETFESGMRRIEGYLKSLVKELLK